MDKALSHNYLNAKTLVTLKSFKLYKKLYPSSTLTGAKNLLLGDHLKQKSRYGMKKIIYIVPSLTVLLHCRLYTHTSQTAPLCYRQHIHSSYSASSLQITCILLYSNFLLQVMYTHSSYSISPWQVACTLPIQYFR